MGSEETLSFSILFRFALKNLTRYKRRSIITAVSIAVGIFVYLISDSLLLGSQRESELNLLEYEIASTRIMDPRMKEEKDIMPMDYLLDETPSLFQNLDDAGYAFAPRVIVSAEMVFYQDPFPEDGSIPVQVTAVDPERDGDVFRLQDFVSQGKYLKNGEEGLVLGEWLAEDIGAELGAFVTLVTRTRTGYYQTMDLEVTGLINSPNPVINRNICLITLEMADFYLETENCVSYIDVKTHYSRDALRGNTLANKRWEKEIFPIRQMVENTNAHVYSWDEIESAYIAVAQGDQYGTVVILFLVFIIAAVGISNTMLMAVMERQREIGMMQALGMKINAIRLLFTIEAGGIGLLGAAAGLILSIPANLFLVNKGIDISFMMRDADIGYRMTGIMRGVWHPRAFILAIISGTFIALLTSWLSTHKILNKTIVESIYDR